jgi:hypothetical protein
VLDLHLRLYRFNDYFRPLFLVQPKPRIFHSKVCSNLESGHPEGPDFEVDLVSVGEVEEAGIRAVAARDDDGADDNQTQSNVSAETFAEAVADDSAGEVPI